MMHAPTITRNTHQCEVKDNNTKKQGGKKQHNNKATSHDEK